MLSRRLKKQILRIITGILFFPIGPAVLMYNESKVIQGEPIFNGTGLAPEVIQWAIRLGATLLIIFCLYRVFSTAKLLMMKIPLTYNEIRTGIYLASTLTGFMVSLVSISLVWIYHKPLVSIILIGVSIVLMVLLLIKGGQRKKQENPPAVSVTPHQSKDV